MGLWQGTIPTSVLGEDEEATCARGSKGLQGSSHIRKKTHANFQLLRALRRSPKPPQSVQPRAPRPPSLFNSPPLVLGQVFARFILWHLAADRAGDFANSIASRSFQL